MECTADIGQSDPEGLMCFFFSLKNTAGILRVVTKKAKDCMRKLMSIKKKGSAYIIFYYSSYHKKERRKIK